MSISNEKICPDCKEVKSRSDFYSYKNKTLAYCKSCSNRRATAYQKKVGYKKSDKAWAKSERICEQCQAGYYPKTTWQKTCSKKCGIDFQNSKVLAKPKKQSYCLRCGESLESKRANALYCSRTCLSMDHTFKHRSKTRVSSTARRYEIFTRDNGECYVCRIQLDFKKLEIDHLIPVSRGGDNSAHNLASSCLFCNRSRGDRIGIRQLEKLFELRPQV